MVNRKHVQRGPVMKWQGRRGSRNIEDRRNGGGTGRAVGGVGGVAGILILIVGWYFGVDVSGFVGEPAGGAAEQSADITPQDERAAEFVSVTLADTEEIWSEIFTTQVGNPYSAPTLVLFKGATRSPCGGASAASRSERIGDFGASQPRPPTSERAREQCDLGTDRTSGRLFFRYLGALCRRKVQQSGTRRPSRGNECSRSNR